MKDTILVYRLPEYIKSKVQSIGKDLDIAIDEIDPHDIHQTMGYLLHLEGYQRQSQSSILTMMQEPFVFFALQKDNQLELLLQLFRLKGIPFIPYKAVLTQHNVNYTFSQLYQSVAKEYSYMTQKPQ